MRVVFTPSAERQIDALHLYISEKASPGIADGFVRRVVDFCERLRDFPQRGTRHDDLLPGLRTIGFERRITIAFMVEVDAILIEGVFYGGQDYARRLRHTQQI